MKKTIAKIMAAAVALSTVVAPNVNATTAVNGRNPVNFQSLQISQLATNANTKNHNLIGVNTVGSRSNPVDAGFTINYGADGNAASVTSDMYLTGTSFALGNDLLFFNPADLANVWVQITDAATTPVDVSDFDGDTVNGAKSAAVATLATNNGVDNSGSTALARVQSAIKDIKTDEVKVSNIANAVTNKEKGSAISNNVLQQTVSNGIFKVDQYIGGDIFDGGYTILADGRIQFLINTRNATKTAQLQAAADSTSPVVFKLTMTFANGLTDWNNIAIGTKEVWVRLASQEEADYDGYVILHQDNGKNRHIGVNYKVDTSGYATIEAANNTVLKSDVVKGGRLYLDYVYDRTNTGENTALASAYKIRTIGSRVFKDSKFQVIGGLGDDGANWIRNIHNGAFRSCKQLKKVNLGDQKKLRKINSKAFKGCKKLATVKLDGRGLKQVGSKAFEGCKSNITFKIKGSSSQAKKAWAKIKKQAPKKAKYSKF